MTETNNNGGPRELALFAGVGGGILGGLLSGWRTVCAVEWDAYAASVLVARQNDGTLAPFPIWDDVQTFNARPWRGIVDVVSGGFPCQDISAAGKGAGIDGVKSGMWKHMARIIGEVRPKFALVENSPMLVGRGLARVLGDLAAMGYDARWGVLGAADVGASHRRDRIWVVATDANGVTDGIKHVDATSQDDSKGTHSDVAHADSKGTHGASASETKRTWLGDDGSLPRSAIRDAAGAGFPNGPADQMGKPKTDAQSERSDWWATEPDLGRMAHGVALRVDRLRCIGNGQVPQVARLAWEMMR